MNCSKNNYKIVGIAACDLEKYLTSGGRLLRPSGCCESIYEYMSNCWIGNATLRPDFRTLVTNVKLLSATLLKEELLTPPLTGESSSDSTAAIVAGPSSSISIERHPEPETSPVGSVVSKGYVSVTNFSSGYVAVEKFADALES